MKTKIYNCKDCGKELDHDRKVSGIIVKYCIDHISQRYAKKAAERREKANRKAKAKRKRELMTASDHENELQPIINAIARLLDYSHGCMSCTSHKHGKMLYAGHYHSVGSNNSLRFNLLNIWNQCYSCNNEKSGNTIGYNLGLIRNYGKEFQERIEYGLPNEYSYMKFRTDLLIEAKKRASTIKRQLEKENRIYTNLERIELREKFNKQIGIYL